MGECSLFRPYVTVYDNGNIEVDWFDSWHSVWDEATNSESSNASETSNRHAHLLDRILGLGYDPAHPVSPADSLRRLADYLDNRTSEVSVD
jgi:hypothetical protein